MMNNIIRHIKRCVNVKTKKLNKLRLFVDQHRLVKHFYKMKKTWPCFFLLLFTAKIYAQTNTALSRSNGLLQFLAQQKGFTQFALERLIGKRCSRYLSGRKIPECQDAVTQMIELLDYDIIFLKDKNLNPKSFVFVAFKTNLKKLLSVEETTVYLDELNQSLYQFLLGEISHLSLWDLTKKHFKTDRKTAMALAVLFQDTSLAKLHLTYLEEARVPGNNHFVENKELLNRVLDTINLILDTSEKNYQTLFYPMEIQKYLNRNIYHFYVPLYLTEELKAHKVSDDASYAATLMLTLTYEFITAANDFRYLLADPKTVNSTHKIQDIFGGYCGSNIGVRGMNFNKSFPQILKSFNVSTKASVELLLTH